MLALVVLFGLLGLVVDCFCGYCCLDWFGLIVVCLLDLC